MTSLTPFLVSRWGVSGNWHQKPRVMACPGIPDQYLTSKGSGYLWGFLAPATRRTYASDEKQFILFCLKFGLVTQSTPLLPARVVSTVH